MRNGPLRKHILGCLRIRYRIEGVLKLCYFLSLFLGAHPYRLRLGYKVLRTIIALAVEIYNRRCLHYLQLLLDQFFLLSLPVILMTRRNLSLQLHLLLTSLHLLHVFRGDVLVPTRLSIGKDGI